MNKRVKENPVIELFESAYNLAMHRVKTNSTKKDLYDIDDYGLIGMFTLKEKQYLTHLTKYILPKENIKVDEVFSNYVFMWLHMLLTGKGNAKASWLSNGIDPKRLKDIPLKSVVIDIDEEDGKMDIFQEVEGNREPLWRMGNNYGNVLDNIVKEEFGDFVHAIYPKFTNPDLSLRDPDKVFTMCTKEKFKELQKEFGIYSMVGYPLTNSYIEQLESADKSKLELTKTAYSGGGKLNHCTIQWENINGVEFGYLLQYPYVRELEMIRYNGKTLGRIGHEDEEEDFKKKVVTVKKCNMDKTMVRKTGSYFQHKRKVACSSKRIYRKRSELVTTYETDNKMLKAWIKEVFETVGLSTRNINSMHSLYTIKKELKAQQKFGVIDWYVKKAI